MENAAAIRYWCHMCSRSVVNPVIEAELIKCNFCESGFVEEMAPDSATDDHHRLAAESPLAPILIGMMNDHHDQQSNVEDEDGEEAELDRQLERIMRRRSSHSAAILDLLRGIREGLSVESVTTNADNPENSELSVMINSVSRRLRIQNLVDSFSAPSGNLGDYFIGPGFELLLQHLAENDPNRYGTPPATKESVEALAVVKIEESLQCAVCLDDFEIGTEAREMPCKHKFHGECLLPWLEQHSSCPVCRHLLPTEDDEEEDEYEPMTDDAETSRNDDDDDDDNDGGSVAFMEIDGSSGN
ncbi:unnamed protein product [Microthlaspi erraticum]|uniref:RING-type E3 ubiquitin transferase n=1 Tax=Microthlaspi erraticum TaxID=1685480 RepID=A0A6D2HNW1_9BRAS|nr:unnamed protein product [Microthlaspi erraticum]